MVTMETRFSHLLQPIRDLTKNWDVDLATQLGEYLEELDQMTISFDGGKTMMNFAEAALLIQGSTCIYGRKVELLHSLVFQTLDCISNKNRRRDKQGSASGVTDGATTDNDVDDCEFDVLGEEPSTHSVEIKGDPAEPVKIVRLSPESLIPAEAHEKQKYPLLSHKGEVLGSCKDFRINNFTQDTMGIMSLGLGSSCVQFNREALAPHMPFPWLSPLGQSVAEVVAVDRYENDDQYDEDGQGGEELADLVDNGIGVEPESDEHVERHQAPSVKRMLRERPRVSLVAEEPKQLQETVDPWKCHDLFKHVGEDKPLKTGKCYNVPAGLDESGKRKRKGSSKIQDFWGWCTSSYGNIDRKLKNGPFYPEFNYMYLGKMGQRLKLRKKVLKKMVYCIFIISCGQCVNLVFQAGVYISDDVLKRTYLEPENQEDRDEVVRHPDVDGDEFSDHENENLVEDHVPEDIISEQDPILNDSQMGRISYEDLVKKSVELFLANSQKYAQETALSRRVREWEDEINPRLLAQEDHVVFDIHNYGDQIVQALGAVGTRRSFASLVKGMENTEACRYMLSSLQLANDYTVEIDKGSGLDESIDTIHLTLLTKERAHERLRTYGTPLEQDLP
ncbi:condensin-2 complex subunit H2, partial [Silurus meridionalis]